jgi:hypothetical protein
MERWQESLDRHITGNYGEDQFANESWYGSPNKSRADTPDRTGINGLIEKTFAQTISLIVMTAGFDQSTEYRKGWLEGYARAYTQMTGKSIYQLIDAANDRIKGSGKRLEYDR